MIVEIPIISEHCGFSGYLRKFKIADKCPICGAKRGIKKCKIIVKK